MFYSKLYKLAKKFAALTDEQYKTILRNPQSLYLLDKYDKLDDFYSSMPDTPLASIEERLSGISKAIEEKKERQPSEEIQKFIESDGDRQIPIDLMKEIKGDILSKDETYSDKESYNYSQYIENITFENFILDYLKSAYCREDKLKKLVSNYMEYKELSFDDELGEKDKYILGELRLNLVQMIITIMKSIFATGSVEDSAKNSLIKAYKLRKSDYFDFLVDDTAETIKPKETEKETEYDEEMEVSNDVEKPTFPNYRDEQTK